MVTLSALDRKLLRDLWGMRGQAIAIALVIVAGVTTYVSMASVMDTLDRTLVAYYADYRFADGFAGVRRAPEHVADRIRRVPGVSEVESRVVANVNLEVPGFTEAVSGQIVSLPPDGQPRLNRLHLRAGRLPVPGGDEEVVLNEAFAEAHGLEPGDELIAIINGRRRTLEVVGVALSPEFLMQVQPGAMFPDPQRFGVLWMGRAALAAAYDMSGAFNDVVFTLAPGADIESVIVHVDALLESYGGRGAYGREDQSSHFYISQELTQLRGTSTLLPTIFLAVAAFLLNIVVRRTVTLQREQIAVLKAFGYSNVAIGVHYSKLVILIVAVGAVAGMGLGAWVARGLSSLYLKYFRFPGLEYALRLEVVLTALALTGAASLVGAVQAVRAAVRLAPAEAMRPAPPAVYRATIVERLGLQRWFDQPTRMIMRHLERQPIKALLTVIGISASCAILIMGIFSVDAFDYMVLAEYRIAQRQDLTVTFQNPTSSAALHELVALPGVYRAEPFRAVPVRLKHGHRSYETTLEGIPPGAALRLVLDRSLAPIPIPAEGIVLARRLAEILAVQPGDRLVVEVLDGQRATREVEVAALAEQYVGIGAYMDLAAVNRLTGEGDVVSGAFLAIDPPFEEAIVRALRDRPRVAGVSAQDRAVEAFLESSVETMLIMVFVMSVFAGVIAFGVVYNSARISLSERDRELASLRVLGFTRGEVAYILLGELAVLVLLAIPVGLVLGAVGTGAFVAALETELYEIPLVLTRRTFAIAATVVLISALASGWIVRRRLDRLDLVGVLKTRD